MKQVTCPFLGIEDDPTTSLSFPSPGNYCHRASPIGQVRTTYQSNYCLSEAHTTCPVYRSQQARPLPPNAAVRKAGISKRKAMALVVLPFLLAGIAAAATLLWMLLPQVLGSRTQIIPRTGETQVVPPFGLFELQGRSTPTPFLPDQSTETPGLASSEECAIPEGWVTYTINPTDSIFRLSIVYSVSVEELQAANCMGDNTVLLPGQVISVPFVPTFTPNTTLIPLQPQFLPTFTAGPIYIPPQPTRTPIIVENPIPVPTISPSPTATLLPSPTVPLPTATLIPFPTVQLPTVTTVPTSTATLIPTATSAPTSTIVIPSSTPAPTNTLVPSPTQGPTNTPPPTSTPVVQPTEPPPDPTATQIMITIIPTDVPTLAQSTLTPVPATATPVPTPVPTEVPTEPTAPVPTDLPTASPTEVPTEAGFYSQLDPIYNFIVTTISP